jgi:photosystem P840 reaction center large subunit
LDGGWIATMMARGNEAYYLTHNISHTGGVFLYMWNETTWIWTDNHLTAMLLLGHLIWFVSFALWFKDRGSRAEGGDIQSRWVRLVGKRLNVKTLQEVRFPVSNLATAKLWGTTFFYTGTFVLVFLYFANGFFQNR